MKFRKKPVVVEAVQWKGDNFDEVLALGSASSRKIVMLSHRNPTEAPLLIPTLEGDMTANLGDWIIKGVNGELYPCKPDIFEMTYQRVED